MPKQPPLPLPCPKPHSDSRLHTASSMHADSPPAEAVEQRLVHMGQPTQAWQPWHVQGGQAWHKHISRLLLLVLPLHDPLPAVLWLPGVLHHNSSPPPPVRVQLGQTDKGMCHDVSNKSSQADSACGDITPVSWRGGALPRQVPAVQCMLLNPDGSVGIGTSGRPRRPAVVNGAPATQTAVQPELVKPWPHSMAATVLPCMASGWASGWGAYDRVAVPARISP